MSKMLRFTEVVADRSRTLPAGSAGSGVLTLGFEDRRRSRMRIRIDDGREAALLLPRGTVLRDGDRIRIRLLRRSSKPSVSMLGADRKSVV